LDALAKELSGATQSNQAGGQKTTCKFFFCCSPWVLWLASARWVTAISSLISRTPSTSVEPKNTR